MRKALPLVLICAPLGAGGCVIDLGKSLHQVSLLDVAGGVPASVRPIEAAESDEVILGITGNTDYVDRAYRALLDACPQGEILNVRARHSTDLGFLAFRRKIRIEAVCAEGSALPETTSPGP